MCCVKTAKGGIILWNSRRDFAILNQKTMVLLNKGKAVITFSLAIKL